MKKLLVNTYFDLKLQHFSIWKNIWKQYKTSYQIVSSHIKY